jgi:hypothetical protein
MFDHTAADEGELLSETSNMIPTCVASIKEFWRNYRNPAINHWRASGSFSPPSLGPSVLCGKTNPLRQRRSGLRIVGRNQRIRAWQIPTLSILLRRHLMICPQMPPQHGKMLAAIETDDVICQH